MTKPGLTAFRAVGELAPLYRWNVYFEAMPAGLKDYVNTTTDKLNLRAESTDLPKDTNQAIEVNLRGHRMSHPGISNAVPNLTMTLVEGVDNYISKLIKTWGEIVSAKAAADSTGAQAVDYLSTIRIERLNNQDNPIWQYKLHNAWMEDAEAGGTLDGATSDFLKPQVILRFDFFTQKAL